MLACRSVPARHMSDPASQQTIVERWNAEGAFEEEIPQVHQQRRADSDGHGSRDIPDFDAHDLEVEQSNSEEAERVCERGGESRELFTPPTHRPSDSPT